MKKKTIAVDIDDVLSSSAADFVAYSNKVWGTNLSIDDYTEHWSEMWGIDQAETDKRAAHIHSSELPHNYAHDETAKDVLEQLSTNYDLVIITSRHRDVEPVTRTWIDRHFNGVFSEIHFAGIWDKGHSHDHASKLTKASIAESIGADYLIDDQPKHCLAAAEAGITSLLFGDYIWSKGITLPPNVVRVKDWTEVGQYFNEEH